MKNSSSMAGLAPVNPTPDPCHHDVPAALRFVAQAARLLAQALRLVVLAVLGAALDLLQLRLADHRL